MAAGQAQRDFTPDLEDVLSIPRKRHYAAITELRQVAGLMRSIHGYGSHPYAVAALRLSALFFVRSWELRGMEWSEIDFDGAFLVRRENDHAYVARHRPQSLRYSAASSKALLLEFLNLNVSKGATYLRVLIAPTAAITDFVRNCAGLKAAAGFYVAVTRA